MAFIFTVVFAFCVAIYIIWPHITSSVVLPEESTDSSIEERKRSFLQVMHELELDYNSGKITANEYEDSKNESLQEMVKNPA